MSGSASLTVTAALAVSLDITPDGASIPIGGQVPLTLTATYSDNTTQTITAAIWSSSDPTLASVDPATGVVTGVASSNGDPITITASAYAMTSTTTVIVTPATIASIQLSPDTGSIAAGATQQYTVNGIFTDGTIQPLTETLSWSSSSASADVDASGLATGRSPGQVIIAVNYGSLSASTTLNVTDAELASVAILPATAAVGINGTVQYAAMGIFTDNSTQDLTAQATWSSSDASVVLIDSSGLATGLQNGTATINATVQGSSGSTTLTVNKATLSRSALRLTALSCRHAHGFR